MKTETIQAKANTPNPTKSVEARIAEALDSMKTPTAASLEPLLDESGATINAAYDTTERERQLSLELSCSDPAAARVRSQDAAFTAERLGGIHEELLLRYRALKAAEARAEHDALVARRRAFVARADRDIEARYDTLIKELMDLAENGNSFSHVREGLRLPSLRQRNVLAFPRPIVTELTNVLDRPARMEPETAATESTPPPPAGVQRGGEEWWVPEQRRRAAQQAEENARQAKYYADRAAENQRRSNEEGERRNEAVKAKLRAEGAPI